MKSRLLLDVVVRKSAAILELLSSKDQTLLVGRDPFLVLDLGLDILDGIGGLDLKSDGLSGKGFDKDLHCESEVLNLVDVLACQHRILLMVCSILRKKKIFCSLVKMFHRASVA
jgi:hypothetical protein